MKVAAIGIGSNSLRMLVADVENGQLCSPKRYREGLRVFAALDEHKNISQEMIDKAARSVLAFQQEALQQGAEEIHLFATSATRDASNQEAFSAALQKATGLALDICSGDTEASLSFWGAAGKERTGLIDIGGGSTEIAVGTGKEIENAVSLQMGAVRFYKLLPIRNTDDAEKVVDMAAQVLAPEKAKFMTAKALAWVGVGGTFTTSAAVVQHIPWQERAKIHGFTMTQENVRAAMEYLSPMPLDNRLQLPCLQPQRADIVVHGIAVLLGCMRELQIPSITVSEQGNLEGYLKSKYLF